MSFAGTCLSVDKDSTVKSKQKVLNIIFYPWKDSLLADIFIKNLIKHRFQPVQISIIYLDSFSLY